MDRLKPSTEVTYRYAADRDCRDLAIWLYLGLGYSYNEIAEKLSTEDGRLTH